MKFQLNKFFRLLCFYKSWKGSYAKGMDRLRQRHPAEWDKFLEDINFVRSMNGGPSD